MGSICCKCCCGGSEHDLADQGHVGEWRVRGDYITRVFAQVLEMVNVLGGDEDNNDNKEANDDDSSNDSSNISDDPFNWLWEPICNYPVHINVACVHEGEVYEYTIYAEEKDLCPFTSNIAIPGTDIKKTGKYFVQWKDLYTNKVYGLNFFTETEALKFLSSCLPPTYTPDAAIGHTSSPSYICPSPPPPLSHSSGVDPDISDDQNYNPRYGFDHLSSTPINQPQFFKLPSIQMQSLQGLTYLKPNVTSEYPPRPSSVSSPDMSIEQTDGYQLSPSQYAIDDDDDDDIDPELFQPAGPLQVNKILEDIPEEDEEESISPVTSLDSSRDDKYSEAGHVKGMRMIRHHSTDIDELIKDLRESQLLEITENDIRLSRQFSFRGAPPMLPPTPPPGPTLSPTPPPGPTLSPTFPPGPTLSPTPPPGPTLSPTPPPGPTLSPTPPPGPTLSPTPPPGLTLSPTSLSLSANINDSHSTDQQEHDDLTLPPPLARQESDEYDLRRQPSFIRYPQPPEGFSSDSGFQLSSDNEPSHPKDIVYRTIRESEAARTSSSPPSVTTESMEEPLKSPSNSGLDRVTSDIITEDDAISRAGWLEVKGVLVRKNKKVAMKANRHWKRYWAVLRGRHIWLHKLDQQQSSNPTNDKSLDKKIDISQSLAHSVHDHVKRDHLFCLSTYSGNTYNMQACDQAAVDDWIRCIHSAAALSMTSQANKLKALEILQDTINANNEALEREKQMKNAAELQLNATSHHTNKSTIIKQVTSLSENIENYNMRIYRDRCYVASLTHSELPNPQALLASISKPTKSLLTKVGSLSVPSLHAVVNVRSSTIKSSNIKPSNDMFKLEGSEEKRRFRFFRSKTKAKRNLFTSPNITQPFHEEMGPHLLTYRELLEPNPLATGFGATLMVQGPNGKICAVPFRLDLTVEDVIFTCCKKFGLDPADYFLKLIATLPDGSQEESMPNEEEFIVNLEFINIEICQKFIISVQFDADDGEMGFSLRPDLRNIGSVTHVIIDFIKPDTQAQKLGLSEGDEVVLINDIPVAHMSWSQVTEAITEPLFTLTVRMRHYQLPLNFTARTTHFHLQDLVCPSPPVVGKTMSKKKLGDLIVPKPTDDLKLEENSSSGSDDPVSESDDDKDRVHQLIQGSLEVTGLVDRWRAYEKEASDGMIRLMDENSVVKMDPQTKMFKCVEEIVKSEKDHIKALELLVDRYLEPMRLENFLPRDKMNSISSNIMTLFVQQKQFLGRIEDLPEDDTINVKKMVDELCEAFTVHLDTFKQYSLFCATQHELDIIFSNVRDDVRLKEFLKARNPKQDHSLTLQSLLTKPVLRLLRYPLFLQALRDLTMKDSDEHRQLTETISSVAVVTEYINEVKRVTELYADAFDLLLERSGLAEFGISVRVNHLLCHVTVMWLNPLSTGGGGGGKGWKKGQGPSMHLFVFNTNITLMQLERQKGKGGKLRLSQEPVHIDDVIYDALLPLAQCKVNDLPDSDGVSSMWQVVHKGRQSNSQTITYILRSRSPKEKENVIQMLQEAIQSQLALYTNVSGSISPVKASNTSYDTNNRLEILKNNPQNDSIDSEYELTML